ncbi:MAG: MptD family putative ECF transporter S component [Saccharofermentans sp.]|nr:MptD family putative ECF transporter S component [Saccharofermentans sp.]
MKKYEVKDLINIGIYTALHFLCIFIVAMIGFIPQTFAFAGILEGFLGAIPFMIFLTKAKKFGMITIMGVLLGLITFLMGRPWPCLVIGLAAGLITDLVWMKADFKKIKYGPLCCGLMMLWLAGMGLPLFFGYRDSYLANLEEGYGKEYVEVIRSLTPDWMFFGSIIIGVIGGFLGGLFAKRILRKHFAKANLVE